MYRQDNRGKQRRHVATKKARGLKRVVLWVQPEHVETHKIAAENPHALAPLRREVEARIEREMWNDPEAWTAIERLLDDLGIFMLFNLITPARSQQASGATCGSPEQSQRRPHRPPG